MKRSTSRILTTHTGSLPRSPVLQELLRQREERHPLNQTAFAEGVRTAVVDVIQQQIAIGLDVINDGEQERSQYAAYVKERLTGFEGERVIRARPRLGDTDFPDFVATSQSSTSLPQPSCTGPITWKDKDAVQRDIATLKAAIGTHQVEEVFMTAASPGVIANFLPNEYYPTEEAYLYALAEAMKHEYEAIVQAGFLLQIDCPDLARHASPSLPTCQWMDSKMLWLNTSMCSTRRWQACRQSVCGYTCAGATTKDRIITTCH